MKRYSPAPPEVVTRMQTILTMSHERLVKHKVTVGVLMVIEDAEDPQPCLKHQGYDAIAIVSKTPTKHRAKGAPDALIEIDQVRWDELSEIEQDAVLDHELTHIEPQTKDSGELKRDGCNRPVIKMRLHDHQFGWFDEIAERHKAASQEVQQYVRLTENVHQQWFEFAKDKKSGGSSKPAGKKKRGQACMGDVAKTTGPKIHKSGRRAAQR